VFLIGGSGTSQPSSLIFRIGAMMKNIFAVLFGIVVLVSNANDSPSY
jgi:hypothetical protein